MPFTALKIVFPCKAPFGSVSKAAFRKAEGTATTSTSAASTTAVRSVRMSNRSASSCAALM